MRINYWAKQLEAEGEIKPHQVLSKVYKNKMGSEILSQIIQGNFSVSAKRWAVEGLGNYSDVLSRELTLKALSNESMTIKLHSIHAISNRGDLKEIKKIKPLIKDESGGIRYNALETLLKYKIKLTKKEIQILQNDEKAYIRKKANSIP